MAARKALPLPVDKGRGAAPGALAVAQPFIVSATANLPKPENFKKMSLGACADKLHEIRDLRRKMQKVVDAVEEIEKALNGHIIDNVPKGDGGAIGRLYKATVNVEDVPTVKDWTQFYAYIVKTKRFDMIQKRLSTAAITELWEAGKKVPGVEKFRVLKVSLTKI